MKEQIKYWVVGCASFAFLFSLAGVASATDFLSRWPRFKPQPHDPAVEAVIKAGEKATSAGKLDEAEKDYKLAESKCLALKKDNEDQLADILSLESQLYRKQAKFDLAISYANKLSVQETKMYGADHILLAEDWKTLGDIQSEAGRCKSAEASFRQAIALAIPADAREYDSCSTAQSSNESRKLELVFDSYKGLTDCQEKDNDLDSADAAYKLALDQASKIKDINAFWYRDLMYGRYVKFLERNDRDASKAKEQWQTMQRTHELNHEYHRGDVPAT